MKRNMLTLSLLRHAKSSWSSPSLPDEERPLNARGIGFLIVEHNLAALTRMVRHMYVMDRGRIIAAGEPAQVLDDPNVQEAYTGGVL